jgi:hypothetical protein
MYLGSAGLTGLMAYLYLSGSAVPFSTTIKPLDAKHFLNLKLQSIEPYNHNTSCFTF